MGKFLQQACEYCYISGYDFRVNQKQTDGKYCHYVILRFELKDAAKNNLDGGGVSKTKILLITDEPISIADECDFITGETIRNIITEEIIILKKQYADYDFSIT